MTENPFLENENEDERPAPLPGPYESALPTPEAALPTPISAQPQRQREHSKCPECGSSEVFLDPSTSILSCSSCAHVWKEPRVSDVFALEASSQNFIETVKPVLAPAKSAHGPRTLKCPKCGAEIVTGEPEARCHWCREDLTSAQQVSSGTDPDLILPFRVGKVEAMQLIKDFAGKRDLFTHSHFRKQFGARNVMGVYLPYAVINGDLSASVQGVGEVKARQYSEEGDKTRYYDADQYEVGRSFDVTLKGLTPDLPQAPTGSVNISDVLNVILPYPVEEATHYSPDYLKGFTSEKQDLNPDQLGASTEAQLLSLVREKAGTTIRQYERGVRWEQEHFDTHGARLLSVYVPLWIYSYFEARPGKDPFVHYVAVNGVTGKVVGSVPVDRVKLGIASAALGLTASLLTLLVLVLGGTGPDETAPSNDAPPGSPDRYSTTDRFGETP